MKKILLITTGGTIASGPSPGGLVPTLTGSALLRHIPEISGLCHVEIVPLINADSSNMLTSDRVLIAGTIDRKWRDYDGIVVTHGTDTVAYTTALLSFMLRDIPVPIAFTGSQLPITAENSDGVNNLYHAFLAAMSPLRGVCLVFNRKIIAGAHVNKISSRKPDAFVSRNHPYLGHIEGDRAILRHGFARRPSGPYRYYGDICEDVFLLKLAPGVKASIFDYVIEQGYRGLILEVYGLCGLPNWEPIMKKLGEINKSCGLPIFLVTQCLYDGADTKTYATGVSAASVGVVSCEKMTPEAAVSKLMWALGQSNDRDTVVRLMKPNSGY